MSENCQQNAHMYYVLISPQFDRKHILDEFKRNDIGAVFHYVPLHSSPAGQKFGKTSSELNFTNSLSEQLIRLPMWVGLTELEQELVVEVLAKSVTPIHQKK